MMAYVMMTPGWEVVACKGRKHFVHADVFEYYAELVENWISKSKLSRTLFMQDFDCSGSLHGSISP